MTARATWTRGRTSWVGTSGWLLCLLLVVAPLIARPAAAACGDGILDEGEVCDDGNSFGGDGCAANCTPESQRSFVIDPEKAFAATQLAFARIEFNLHGIITVTTGQPSEDGFIPLVLREDGINLEAVAVPGIACACVFSKVDPRFGANNVGFGGVDCGEEGAVPNRDFVVPEFFRLWRDHNTDAEDPNCELGTVEGPDDPHPGVCMGPLLSEITPKGGRGTLGIITNMTIRLVQDSGTCCQVGVDPFCTDPLGAKGPDGLACTADDPTGPDDPAQTIFIDLLGALTGTIRAELFDSNNVPGANIAKGETCGADECLVELQGERFDCDVILSSPTAGADTGTVVLAFPVPDARDIGDGVVTAALVPKREERPPCTGDCDGGGTVAVNELVRGVNIALGNADIGECRAFDRNGDDSVTIDELVAAVNHALEGC